MMTFKIGELIDQKKFKAAVIAAVIAGVSRLGFEISIEDVTLIISPILTYIFGQSISDFGKDKQKLINEILETYRSEFNAIIDQKVKEGIEKKLSETKPVSGDGIVNG